MQETGSLMSLNCMVAGILRILTANNFPANVILFCSCRSQMFEPCHSFEGFISYPFVTIFSNVLVT